MKSFVLSLLILAMGIYVSSCGLDSYKCAPPDLQFTVDVKTVDYYTSNPIKQCSFKMLQTLDSTSSNFVTNDTGAVTISKQAKSGCDFPNVFTFSVNEGDSLYLPVPTATTYILVEPTGKQSVNLKIKRRTVPVKLNLKHQNSETDSLKLDIGFHQFGSTKWLQSKNISTKNAFDSTYIFNTFPEVWLDYKYTFKNKSGILQNVSQTIGTPLKDTLKIDISY